MGFAAIARVTEDRWITCSSLDHTNFGLKPGDELEVETTLCHEVRLKQEAVFIDNVAKDEKYKEHHTPKIYGLQSYASYPIFRKNGEFFGTLCAIDSKPFEINTPEVRGMFKLFSDLISFHLDMVEGLNSQTERLKEEQEMADLRDQFIAILGHDLKNPIATMRMSSDILLKMSKDELTQRHAALIKSTSYRMQGLIENILDFARGKLGDGLLLDKESSNGSLENIIGQVVNEIKNNAPEREINLEIDLKDEVYCDRNRIAQLLSNLLSNANHHGDPKAPVEVKAFTNGETFELSVSNKGEKISETAMKHLFEPFYRESSDSNKKGLGLGLFIASEIAKAHDGELLVCSSNKETIFTLQIPITEEK
ncbi:GAF domain-containing sensor histidine kinase [Salinimicrobium sp. CDJ15-81-2]|nr:GAF domain-containing sensor histidine kinase [Salinimicrobium nanhaiense]